MRRGQVDLWLPYHTGGHGGLLTPDGRRITNIYPYDADGEPLSDVRLYDQDGNPVEIIVELSAGDGRPVVTSFPLAEDGSPVTHAFPQRQAVRPGTGWDSDPDAAEPPRPGPGDRRFGERPDLTVPPLEGP